jgi:crossover junction endodeoxyribonuclease RusA
MSDSFRVELPWPTRILHPNERGHWGPKSRAAAKSREVAGLLTRSRLVAGKPALGERIKVRLTFKPPNNNKHDIDGCLSANKHALDGVADALKVDDSRFELELHKGEKIKGGMVVVEIA